MIYWIIKGKIVITELSQNHNIINQFLQGNNFKKLLINNISDEINLFYIFFISHFAKSKFDIKIVNSSKELSEENNDLFGKQILYISFKKINADINSKLIIYVPYSDIKKNKDYLNINAYNIDADIKYLIDQYNIKDENKFDLYNKIKLDPHMIISEIEKTLVNKYDSIKYKKNDKDDIANLRFEIFKLKKDHNNLKDIYDLIKKETAVKKFNFLTY